MPDVRDRQYLITMHKKARKSGLDLHMYNQLKDQMSCVQTDLARLRDPLIPPHRSQVLFDPLAGHSPSGTESQGLWSDLMARLKSLRDVIRGDGSKKTTANRI